MWKNYEFSTETEESVAVEIEKPKAAKKTKKAKKVTRKYIAVKGVSLDKFKARFRVGDEIPLAYLEDPEVDFEHLLAKGAIKEVLED